jgi:predicted secreted Zn-dependent protease
LRKLILIIALVTSSWSSAAVVENVTYSTYDVDVAHARSMTEALDMASPHRKDGKAFYGFTTWSLLTTYQLRPSPNGSCKLDQIETKLTVNIDLPRLLGADARQTEAFNPFLSALRVHELGHYTIGQEAAAAVDSRIAALPEMASCKFLDAAVGVAHLEIMREFDARSAAYDVETNHGKTQGAWLKGPPRRTFQFRVMPPRSS